ncbi:isoprenoid synthase domain-containing protein [Obelidium mucronatum]|nr:isoprenoid synthase domain-containing protein [Obelidium mucronatum]
MATKALLESIQYPSEVYALLKYKFTTSDCSHKGTPEYSYQMCYYFLNKTSRSFARVIQELHPELSHAVCVFYLTLQSSPILRSFDKIMYKKGWTFTESGPKEKDRILLVDFDVVIDEFLRLKESYQTVIADIARRMGNGMADFCAGKKVETIADYDLYTHYVAGLVGIGLTGLFSVSGLEDASLTKDEYLQNRMGLFLQKVNIMKDYLEDLNDGRQFWPREVWEKYVWEGQGLDALAKPENLNDALACLNELCVNAMELAPDCLEYMSKLKEPSVIHFCAIPQVMAIASIALFFNNKVVFTAGGLKIRRGLAVKLIYKGTTFEGVKEVFKQYALDIARQNSKRVGTNPKDESFMPMSIACSKVIRWINQHDAKVKLQKKANALDYVVVVLWAILFALIAFFLAGYLAQVTV